MNRILELRPGAHVVNRHERSPLEFQGALMFESDGCSDSKVLSDEPRYRIRVYEETGRGYVVEIAVVARDTVMLQLADFADSPADVDDLLCLFHGDAMDGLRDVVALDTAEIRLLDKRLEAALDRQSLHILEKLRAIVADQA